jgi:hypothetical protein
MLFADYASLLRINGISWITRENPKVSIWHIVDAFKPKPLQARVKDDVDFSHTHLKKDFLKFMDHVIKRAEIYSDYEEPAVFASSKGSVYFSAPDSRSTGERSGSSSGQHPKKKTSGSNAQPSNAQKTAPDCLNPNCKEKHFLKEYKNTTQERKDELYAQRAQARKASGDQRKTRADARAGVSSSGVGTT